MFLELPVCWELNAPDWVLQLELSKSVRKALSFGEEGEPKENVLLKTGKL